MTPEQQEVLCFYLGIEKPCKETLNKYRTLVYSYYRDRCTVNETNEIPMVSLRCDSCGNTEEKYMRYHEHEGIRICIGKDGQGCGTVLTDYELMEDCVENVPLKLYSSAYFNRSYLDRSGGISRINGKVERQLTRYTTTNLTTSEFYKNKQRKKIYMLLDQLKDSRVFYPETIEKTKQLFNVYRTAMSRIHKVKMVVYILIEHCNTL